MHRSHRFAVAIPWVAACLLATVSGAGANAGTKSHVADGGSVVDRGARSFGVEGTSASGTTTAEGAGRDLQTFTAGGHVLGFAPGGFHLSNGSYALRVDFVGAQPVDPVQDGAGAEGGGVVNADADADTADAAPPLTEVTYRSLWDGIDLSYDAPPLGIARSTWTLAPGADPAAIRLRYNRPVALGTDGALTLDFDRGTLSESAPVAWQDAGGRRVPVAVRFAPAGPREVGFAVGAYDPALALVIDPTLAWNTFLGGSAEDSGKDIALDGSGNVYVVGQSWSTWGSPVRSFSGVRDAFAAKLDPDGNLVWNTFLGGGDADGGSGIAVSGSGNVYVSGGSGSSWGSPVRGYSSGYDAFAAKLDTGGNLVWNTFLGASGEDSGLAIAVDGSGNAFAGGVSAATWGSPVRAYSSGNDAFAAKLDSGGNLVWNTFLGTSGSDSGSGIAVDGSGNVFVCGTSSATWGSPVRGHYGGSYGDAFAAKLDSGGNLTWNTFLGGSEGDGADDITVGGDGTVYVAGYSNGTWGSPVRAYSGFHDGFAAKLEGDGDLVWNTFLGNSNADFATSIAVNGAGDVYVVGQSSNTWGSPWRSHSGGGDDVFAVKLEQDGDLVWIGFLGGSGSDGDPDLAIDGNEHIFVGGWSDASWGSPVRAYSGDDDAFVAMINDPPPTSTPTPSNTPTATATPTSTPTPSQTPTPTPLPTWTPWIITATPVPTDTPTHTATHTPTPTVTRTPTATATLSIPRGDCNADAVLDAADVSALTLEIFDGDGMAAAGAPGGSFAGSPSGCDANADAAIDAGDLSCAVLRIFGSGGCGP